MFFSLCDKVSRHFSLFVSIQIFTISVTIINKTKVRQASWHPCNKNGCFSTHQQIWSLLKSQINMELTQKKKRSCKLFNLGQVTYQTGWEWQKKLVAERKENPDLEDILILLEHYPVYTLGQGANLEYLKFDPHNSNYELYQIERGGEVTYHCPGQLVGYPILNLHYYQQDLHWYLRQLEEVLIRVISIYGLKAERISGMTGVWLEDVKIAAIGIKVSKWITMHGFALNVCPDLAGFNKIIPCGIKNKSVGSLKQFIPDINITLVRQQIVEKFAEVFAVEIIKSIDK